MLVLPGLTTFKQYSLFRDFAIFLFPFRLTNLDSARDEIVRQYDLLVQRLNERGIEFDLDGSIGGVVTKGANLWFGYSIFCKRSLSHTTN